MKFIKNVSFSIIYIIASLLILTFITTVLSYFNIIGDKTTSLFKIFIPVISLFIGGFNIGSKSNKKGWLEGLKVGLIYLVLLIIFDFLAFNNSFEIKNILYYIIIVISGILGSMVGISIKKTD